MNKKNSCPLDGSWAQEHCFTHSKNIKNGRIPKKRSLKARARNKQVKIRSSIMALKTGQIN